MITILYLGLEAPIPKSGQKIVHLPLIKIVPRPLEDPAVKRAFDLLPTMTHLLFTSKTAVELFFAYATLCGYSLDQICTKCIATVGSKTADRIRSLGAIATIIAKKETAEGLIERLTLEDMSQARVLWPHSALSRTALTEWLQSRQIDYYAPIFYDTEAQIPEPLPDLAHFDQVWFTSPSTVDAFLRAYGHLPADKVYRAIGPVTEAYIVLYAS